MSPLVLLLYLVTAMGAAFGLAARRARAVAVRSAAAFR